jgi:hypothetical protein
MDDLGFEKHETKSSNIYYTIASNGFPKVCADRIAELNKTLRDKVTRHLRDDPYGANAIIMKALTQTPIYIINTHAGERIWTTEKTLVGDSQYSLKFPDPDKRPYKHILIGLYAEHGTSADIEIALLVYIHELCHAIDMEWLHLGQNMPGDKHLIYTLARDSLTLCLMKQSQRTKVSERWVWMNNLKLGTPYLFYEYEPITVGMELRLNKYLFMKVGKNGSLQNGTNRYAGLVGNDIQPCTWFFKRYYDHVIESVAEYVDINTPRAYTDYRADAMTRVYSFTSCQVRNKSMFFNGNLFKAVDCREVCAHQTPAASPSLLLQSFKETIANTFNSVQQVLHTPAQHAILATTLFSNMVVNMVCEIANQGTSAVDELFSSIVQTGMKKDVRNRIRNTQNVPKNNISSPQDDKNVFYNAQEMFQQPTLPNNNVRRVKSRQIHSNNNNNNNNNIL